MFFRSSELAFLVFLKVAACWVFGDASRILAKRQDNKRNGTLQKYEPKKLIQLLINEIVCGNPDPLPPIVCCPFSYKKLAGSSSVIP
jgi:hypothetical protein